MSRVFIERRKLSTNVAVTWDLALHMYARVNSGTIVVLSENPPVARAALRKQWLKVLRKLENERARTLNAARRETIALRIQRMENIAFSVDPYTAHQDVTVYFLAPKDFPLIFTAWHTTYMLLAKPDLHLIDAITTGMSAHGLLVEYGRSITGD
jgi:hypothetical protein